MDALVAVLAGVPNTILLTVAALLVGALGGIPLMLGRQAKSRVVRGTSRMVIEILRGIPPLVWLFIIFFGVGASLPDLSPLLAAIIGLGLISSAYMAEIYRSGLSAIGTGQWEAGSALGLRRATIWVTIIGPQVARVSLPAGATYSIGLLKDSSVAYTIGVTEVMFFANQQAVTFGQATAPFITAAAVYLVLTIPLAWVSRVIDAKLRQRVNR